MPMVLRNHVEHLGYGSIAHNVQRNQVLIPIALWIQRQSFVLFFAYFRGECSAGGLIKVEFSCFLSETLSCSYRVCNRRADVIGRYAICVKTVLLILFEGSTSIPTFDGFFPSRKNCLAAFWKVYAEVEMVRLGNGIAVSPWQLLMMGVRIAEPWQLFFYESWDCPDFVLRLPLYHGNY